MEEPLEDVKSIRLPSLHNNTLAGASGVSGANKRLNRKEFFTSLEYGYSH